MELLVFLALTSLGNETFLFLIYFPAYVFNFFLSYLFFSISKSTGTVSLGLGYLLNFLSNSKAFDENGESTVSYTL